MSDVIPQSLTLNRVALQLGDSVTPSQRQQWQRRVSQALERVAIAPPMPPQAILIVRRLPDPHPGLLLSLHQSGSLRTWEQAAQTALADCWRRAVRPALGPVPATADSVWFADTAEWLACLSWDLHQGTAGERWWWQTALRSHRDRNRHDTLYQIWRDKTQWLPATLTLMLRQHRDATVALLTTFAAPQIQHLLMRSTAIYNCPLPTQPNTSTPDYPRLLAALRPYILPVVGNSIQRLPLATQALMAVCLTLPRTAQLLQEVQPGDEAMIDRASGRETREERAGTESTEDTGKSRGVQAAVGRPEERKLGERKSKGRELEERKSEEENLDETAVNAAASVLDNGDTIQNTGGLTAALSDDFSAGTADSTPVIPRASIPKIVAIQSTPLDSPRPGPEQTIDASDISLPAAPVNPAVDSVEGESTETVRSEHSPIQSESDSSSEAQSIPLVDTALAPDPGIATSVGGLWYLVNILVALDWPGQSPPLTAWHQLIALAQALLPEVPLDPVWEQLVAIAGDPMPEPQLAQWQTDVLAQVTPYLADRLEQPEAIADIILEPATLHITRTHIDVIFTLEQIRLDVRQAGLDQDPGWVPELARVITFHYE